MYRAGLRGYQAQPGRDGAMRARNMFRCRIMFWIPGCLMMEPKQNSRDKIMGADVAASPHCPRRGGHQAWEARQSARGGFEAGPGPKPETVFRSPSRRSRAGRCPRRLSDGAEAPTDRLWRMVSPLRRSPGRNPDPASAGPLAEASGPPGEPATEAACPPAQLPGRNPVLPDRSERPKPPVPTGGSPETCVPFPPGFPRTGALVPPAGSEPEGSESWALDEACHFRLSQRTSPQLPPGGGFVSRPAFVRSALVLADFPRPRSGCGPQSSDRCRSSSRPRPVNVIQSDSHQAESACG